jgi:hypothetical protein
MDDPTSATPPRYSRVLPPRCPQCDRSGTTRLEHVMRGDLVTSTWACSCGANWPAERDLAAPQPAVSRRSRTATVIEDLRELVAALDRRLPHFNARREHLVAGMSASLREQAIERIARLEERSEESGAALRSPMKNLLGPS